MREAPTDRKVLFVVPVHNEEKIITSSIEKLLHFAERQDYPFAWRIHIAVNGSRDRTLEIARALQDRFPRRLSVTDFVGPGRGAALKGVWLASDADIVSYMDVDLAVSLEHLAELVRPIWDDECDMVIGSRNLAASRIKRSFLRELISQSYNRLSRLILGHGYSDLQCGFKAIRLEALKVMAPNLHGVHWFFDTELVIWTQKYGFRIQEIPVDWSENRFEKRKSKVRLLRDSLVFFLNLLRLKIRMRTIIL